MVNYYNKFSVIAASLLPSQRFFARVRLPFAPPAGDGGGEKFFAPENSAHGSMGVAANSAWTAIPGEMRGLAGTLFCVTLLLLAGCATSRVPQAISKAPEKPVLVSQVQQAPDRFLDRRVRWGGTIIAVRNRKQTTEIEILSRPLDSRGRPRGKKSGQGRFLALLTGFADPAEYPEQRLLTVTGRLKRVETRPIGEYPYLYPVVAVEQPYLWPKPLPSGPPYFYPDPWYHPWFYPWHPRYSRYW